MGAYSVSDTLLTLRPGGGDTLPEILRGSASSTGDARTLNDTGDLGDLEVGDDIYNFTDGSWAVVISVASAPNSIRTTPLEGGSDNTWTSGDVWVKGLFVTTLVQFNENGTFAKLERVLVENRVDDVLTVVRGFDGDMPQSFVDGDYVQLLAEEAQFENIHQAIRNVVGKIDAIHRGTPFTATSTGSANTYAATLTPVVTAYTDIAGVTILLNIHAANSGASTLNLHGLGAKNIRKEGGQTALASGDLSLNMPALVVYNASLDCFVLINAVANPPPLPTGLTTTNKTADYTAVAGNLVVCDTTTQPIAVTLPASPTVDDKIGVALATVGTYPSLALVAASTQYASIADGSQTGLDLTGNFTIEYWIKQASQPSSGNYHQHVSKYNASGNQRGYVVGYKNSTGTMQLAMTLSNDGSNTTEKTVNYTLTNDVWYHVAFAYNASAGTCEVYVNGVSVGTMTALPTSVYNNSGQFEIGRGGSLGGPLNGVIDDVRVWNSIRTVSQISANYQTPLVGNESNLQGYWKFDNNYEDATANNNDLTANGTPKLLVFERDQASPDDQRQQQDDQRIGDGHVHDGVRLLRVAVHRQQ
ncbi:MAG: LamG domain-containing protein [Pirellulales bacterium]